MRYYILENKVPVKVEDVLEWAKFLENTNKVVAKTDIEDASVSTVFFGIDHNFSNTSDPILFETMIFGGKYDGYQDRYSTWDEAEKGHKVACELVSK